MRGCSCIHVRPRFSPAYFVLNIFPMAVRTEDVCHFEFHFFVKELDYHLESGVASEDSSLLSLGVRLLDFPPVFIQLSIDFLKRK